MEEFDKDGENLFKSAEFANSIKQMLEQKTEYIKMIRLFAELRAEKYQALVDAGFTEAQALHIATNSRILE